MTILTRPVAAGLLAVGMLLSPVLAQAGGPLQSIARRIPAAPKGLGVTVHLIDVQAARGEAARFTAGLDHTNATLLAFVPLALPAGFPPGAVSTVITGGGDMAATIGFGLDDIRQIAGWGPLVEAPVVMTGPGVKAKAVAAALEAHGFAADTRFGTTVWYRQDDFAIDIARKGEANPFSANLGMSQRFAFDGETLLFTRGWAAMKGLVSPGATVADDWDMAAVLAAGYAANGRGRLIEVVFVTKTNTHAMARAIAAQAGIATATDHGLPGLPRYGRFALLHWQDGARVSGAIAIPYRDRAAAELALARFPPLLDHSISARTKEPMAKVLPYARHFSVVETPAGPVLVLAFEQVIDLKGGVRSMSLFGSPFQRLYQMLVTLDLSMLLVPEE